MFNSTGIDVGTTGTRKVSIGRYWGAPARGDLGGSQTATVPSDKLTFRKVTLPPAGRAACRQMVENELAFSLPFPLDEAAWAYSGSPGTEAWVVVTPRDKLVDVRKKVGLGVALDAEPLSLYRAAHANGVRSALVIDLGASKTTFCAILPGQLEWVRVLLRGGNALTQRIATESKLSRERAEEIKRQQGCDLGTCRHFIDELLEEALTPGQLPYDRVLLSGGGAAMLKLQELLRSRLKVEVELFPMPAPLSPLEDVVAYGTALSEKIGQPRARLMSLSVAEGKAQSLRQWTAVAVLAVACCVLVVVQMEARVKTLRIRQNAAHAQLTTLLAGVGVKSQELEDPSGLVKRLQGLIAERKSERSMALENVVDSLARAAGPVKDVKSSDVRALSFDGTKFHLEGQAGSMKDVAKLRDALGKIFGDVQQDKAAPGPDNRYVYQFEWKLPES